MPAVSVLLPAFGAARTIRSALRSIRRQTYRDFECVVVDDGSTDATAEIAVAFASLDARFRVLRRAHEGLVPALMAGLAECRGRLIARMDADDLMTRDRLAAQVGALDAEASLAAVAAHVTLAPRRGLQEGSLEYEKWIASVDSPARVEQDLFVECPVVHPTLMIRADVVRELGWRDRGVPEDYDLVLRLVGSRRRIGVVPRPLLVWRQGERRLQRTSPAYSHDAFARLKAEFLVRGFLRDAPRYTLVGFGNSGKRLRAALAREARTCAVIVDLHRQGNVTDDGVRIVAPEALGSLPRLPILACVSGAAGRAEIRGELARLGFVDLRDFVCCA